MMPFMAAKLGAVQGSAIVIIGERWSRVSAHHEPGEATLTPVILVRIQVPQPCTSPTGQAVRTGTISTATTRLDGKPGPDPAPDAW